jgi:hypothetical protein
MFYSKRTRLVKNGLHQGKLVLHRIPRPLNRVPPSAKPHWTILCVVIGISQLKARNNSPAPKMKLNIALIILETAKSGVLLIDPCLFEKIVYDQFVAKK